MLSDSYGRVATDLRVSLTDRCNLRCQYCMPAEGLPWLPKDELLSNDELVRLIDLAVRRLGITTIRLTGGEPLLRPDLIELVSGMAALRPRPRLALTTNGIGLATRAAALADAGLDRVNISLDTIDADTFRAITRRRRLPDVLAGIRAARDAGLTPVKVNAVLLRGVNDHEAPALLRWAMDEGIELRFIEQMPLDAQHGWQRDAMVTADETQRLLEDEFGPLLPESADERGSAPAERFLVPATSYRVGIIAAVTRPFCGACDRVRLTADGQLRNCLFARAESDLRGSLRAGVEEDALLEQWRAAVATKLPGHGIDDPTFLQPDRPMSAIGG